MSTTPSIPEDSSPHPEHERSSIKSVPQEATGPLNSKPSVSQPHSSPTNPIPADPGKSKNHWEICLEHAQKHIEKEVDTWKDEIANLLLFATLFAGVAGTFAIESYHNVTQDPADTTVLLLKTLVALQLNATNPQPNLSIDLDPQNSISTTARRINIYNFVSLILSLVVVVVGIVCLQWLREYGRDTSSVPVSRKEQVGVCLMRSDGIEKWRVFGILKMLPVILLLSLLVFFIGIVELLLEADTTAAIVASVIILLAYLFLATTTMLPTLQIIITRLPWQIKIPQCPYKSPQAWIFYQFVRAPSHIVSYVMRLLRRTPNTSDTLSSLEGWPEYDHLMHMYFARFEPPRFSAMSGVYWLGSMYLHEERLASALYGCLENYATRFAGYSFGAFSGVFNELFSAQAAVPAATVTPSTALVTTAPTSSVAVAATPNIQSATPTARAAMEVIPSAATEVIIASADSPAAKQLTALADLPLDALDDMILSMMTSVHTATGKVATSIALSATTVIAMWSIRSTDPLYHILAYTDTRRANSLKRALLWTPPDGSSFTHRVHISDVIAFQVLAHLVEKNERGQPSTVLLRRRLELFIKICKTRLDQDIDCPQLVEGAELIVSRSMQQEVLRCILDLMQNADLNETHMDAVANILSLEVDEPAPKIQPFDDALQAVEGWMKRRSPDSSLRDKPVEERTSIEEKMLTFQDDIETLRGYIIPKGVIFWRDMVRGVDGVYLKKNNSE